MRDYGKVHSTFWSSDTTSSVTDDGRMLALYLMTSPHATIAGVFRLPDGYVCEDLKWDAERVSKGFSELLAKGFANRCETTKWVWVCKHFKWNQPENPNQRKAAKKVAEQIPSDCAWKALFFRDCGVFFDAEPLPKQKGLKKGSETVSKPGTGTGTGTGKEKTPASAAAEREGEIEMPAEHQARFDRFWSAYPKRKGKGDAVKSWLKLKPSEALLEKMLAAVSIDRGGHDWTKDSGQYIPYPATWLNQSRWLDDRSESGGDLQFDDSVAGVIAGAMNDVRRAA